MLSKLNKLCIYLTDVALSSDFISGFCGETDEDHKLTVDLMREVKYNFAFCFPYSMRQVCHQINSFTGALILFRMSLTK